MAYRGEEVSLGAARGFGPFAALLKARFSKARSRFGLERNVTLRRDKFLAPRPSRAQLDLGF
jgi:hypothetical protein